MGQRRCKGCQAVLYETVPLDPEGKDWAMTPNSPARHLHQGEGQLYLECPNCRRRLYFRAVGEHTIAPVND